MSYSEETEKLKEEIEKYKQLLPLSIIKNHHKENYTLLLSVDKNNQKIENIYSTKRWYDMSNTLYSFLFYHKHNDLRTPVLNI